MQQFFRMMAIFMQHPWLAALVGVLLLALGRWRGRGVAVATGIVWLLYAVYENGDETALVVHRRVQHPGRSAAGLSDSAGADGGECSEPASLRAGAQLLMETLGRLRW